MKQLLVLPLLSVFAVPGSVKTPHDIRLGPKLHVFMWFDYVDPDVVRAFEEKYGCSVVFDYYDSNEALRDKIVRGGAGYDLINPSNYMVKELEPFLEKLDKSKIPNLKNVDPLYKQFALDPNMTYGVPYMVTYTGIAWRDDILSPPPEQSWSVFDRPDLAGYTTLLGDMRETLGAALRYNGHSLNSKNADEIAEARDTVIRWKKHIATFENEKYKVGIASGEFKLVHGWAGDIGLVQCDDEGDLAPDRNHVQFFLPKEGFSMSCDEWCILKDSKNKDLAYKFIDFLHDGKVAAKNIQFTTYWCPNSAARKVLEKEAPEVLENPTIFPDPEDLKRGEMIGNVGLADALYEKAWDEVLSAPR